MTDTPDATPAEATSLLDKVAIALHDAECHDRTCNGPALGAYYGQARVALDTAVPLIAARAAAAQREADIKLARKYDAVALLANIKLNGIDVERFADLLAAAPEETP